jgi:WD40 repeat protein
MKRKGLLFACLPAAVMLLVLAAGCNIRTLLFPAEADSPPQAYPLQLEPSWRRTPYPLPMPLSYEAPEFQPHGGYVTAAVIALDYQTLQPRAAYFSRQPACRDPDDALSDLQLEQIASDFLSDRIEALSHLTVAGEQIPTSLVRSGELAVLEFEPGGLRATAIMNACSGEVLFAEAAGPDRPGKQIYPEDTYPQRVLASPVPSPYLRVSLQAPTQIEVLHGFDTAGYGKKDEEGLAAWEVVRNSEQVLDLARWPYNVLVYLNPGTTSEFNPDEAEWIVIAAQSGTGGLQAVDPSRSWSSAYPPPEPYPHIDQAPPTSAPYTQPTPMPTLTPPASQHERLLMQVGSAELRAFALSNDRRQAVAMFGSEISLFSGRQLQPGGDLDVEWHQDMILGYVWDGWELDLHPSGQRLVTFDMGKIVILDWSGGRVERIVLSGEENTYRGSWSPDGERLAAIDVAQISIWSLATRSVERRLVKPEEGVAALAWSPDGRWLAVGGWSGNVIVWEVETSMVIAEMQLQAGISGGLAFSPDGSILAAASWTGYTCGEDCQSNADGSIETWDLASGERLLSVQTGVQSGALAFSPDGSRLAVNLPHQAMVVYDLKDGRLLGQVEGVGWISFPYWQAGGEVLSFLSASEELVTWRVTTGETTRTRLLGEGFLWRPAWSPDGSQFASSNGGEILIWQVETGQLARRLTGSNSRYLDWSPDGFRIAIGNLVLDARTGELLAVLENGPDDPDDLRWSPDGRMLAVLESKTASLMIFDSSGNSLLVRDRLGYEAYKLSWSTDSSKIAILVSDIARQDHDVIIVLTSHLIIEASSGQTLKNIDAYGLSCLTWLDDRHLVTSAEKAPAIFDWKRGVWVKQMDPNPEQSFCRNATPAVSHDGRYAALACQNIYIWDIESGKLLMKLDGVSGLPVFSPDGRLLLVDDGGGILSLYNGERP